MFTGSIVMDHLCFLFLGVSLKHTDGPSRGFFSTALSSPSVSVLLSIAKHTLDPLLQYVNTYVTNGGILCREMSCGIMIAHIPD